MGLCKCPKKRITTQFCFEHRVNVCEYCMVTNHPKCIVQSYLLWLRDNDYSPICTLCSGNLADGDCVRLICYHMFHWACLDNCARNLPATTAPAGYTCPTCQKCIFPEKRLVSPVCDVLIEKLAGVNWARAGLGLPLLSEDKEQKPELARPKPIVDTSTSYQNHISASVPTVAMPRTSSNVNSMGSNLNNLHHGSQKTGPPYSVVHMDSTLSNLSQMSQDDHDENKYQRKSAIERFLRWSKLITQPPPQARNNELEYFLYEYKNVFILLGVFSLVGIVLGSL